MLLADIIEDLYRNRNKLNDFVGLARKAVIEKYNWKTDGANLIKLYDKIKK